MNGCKYVSKKDKMTELNTFDWSGFQPKNLQMVNKEKNPDIYGTVYIAYKNQKFIADVQWETKEAYDRNGISINLYCSNAEGNHCYWIEDIHSIVTATNYERFKNRAEKEILSILKDFCDSNTRLSN